MREKILEQLIVCLRALDLDAAQVDFSSLCKTSPEFSELVEQFPNSYLTGFLKTFPDLFVTYRIPRTAMFLARLNVNGTDASYKKYVPELVQTHTLIVTGRKNGELTQFTACWADKPDREKSLIEALHGRYELPINKKSVELIEKALRVEF